MISEKRSTPSAGSTSIHTSHFGSTRERSAPGLMHIPRILDAEEEFNEIILQAFNKRKKIEVIIKDRKFKCFLVGIDATASGVRIRLRPTGAVVTKRKAKKK